jgi:hypothetical protein
MKFHPGLVKGLFQMSPTEAAALLREADALMREYKDTQVALYDSLGVYLDRDIQAMEATSAIDWNGFLANRGKEYKQELESLRSQELRLEAELDGLKGAEGTQAQSVAMILRDQLTQLKELKDKVGNQVIAMDSAAGKDIATTQQTVLRNLKAHRAEVEKFRKMEVATRTYMENYYKYMQAAVEAQPAGETRASAQDAGAKTAGSPPPLPKDRSPETAAVKTGSGAGPAGGQPPAKSAQAAPRPPAKKNWGRWVDVGGRESETWPPRMLFELRSVEGENFKATFTAWFKLSGGPNVQFDCNCNIIPERINCDGEDAFISFTLQPAASPPTPNTIPDELRVKAIRAWKTVDNQKTVWNPQPTTLTLKSPAPAQLLKSSKTP